MDITVFDVGFGQSILMEEDRDQLLVDCGSSDPKYGATISCIRDKLQQPNTLRRVALLTHYHKDHYSFFSKLGDQLFDGFYLPFVAFHKKTSNKTSKETGKETGKETSKEESKLECTLAEEAMLGYILEASCKIDADMLLCNQIKKLLELVKDSGWVAVPRRGDVFRLGRTKCEVLWPDIPHGVDSLRHEHKRREQIQHIKSILDEYIEDHELFNQTWDNIIKNLYDFYGSISDITDFRGEDVNDFGQIRHRNIEERRYPILREQLQSILAKQTENMEKLNKISNTFWESFKGEGNQAELRSLKSLVSRIFNHDNNAVSIVFQDLIEEEEYTSNWTHRFLMTGDITKKIIEKRLFTHEPRRIYDVIQCPHHGTKSHFSASLPHGKQLIISNKKYKNYGGVSFLYGYFYPFLVGGKSMKGIGTFVCLPNKKCPLCPFQFPVKHFCTNADTKTCESLQRGQPCPGCVSHQPSVTITV